MCVLSGLTSKSDPYDFDIEKWKDLPFLNEFISELLNKAIPNLHDIASGLPDSNNPVQDTPRTDVTSPDGDSDQTDEANNKENKKKDNSNEDEKKLPKNIMEVKDFKSSLGPSLDSSQRRSSMTGTLSHLQFKNAFGGETQSLINQMMLLLSRIVLSINQTSSEEIPEIIAHLDGIVEPMIMRGASVLLTGASPLLLSITLKYPTTLKRKALKILTNRLIGSIRQCNNCTAINALLHSITMLTVKYNDLIMDYVKGISPIYQHNPSNPKLFQGIYNILFICFFVSLFNSFSLFHCFFISLFICFYCLFILFV